MLKQDGPAIFHPSDENGHSGSKRQVPRETASSTSKRQPLGNITNSLLAPTNPFLRHKNAGPFSLGDSIWSSTQIESSQFKLPQSKPSLNSSLLLSSPDFQQQLNSELPDIDAPRRDDTGCIYAQEVFDHLKQAEVNFKASCTYMSKQPDITHSMRAVLIDWLSEVAEEYRLQQETLYLCVSFVDRFLSKMAVNRGKLQLLGTSCMYLAAKMEEIYPPNINEFVYITDNSYTKKQVIEMEKLVLATLEWNLITPTVNIFLHRYLCVVCADDDCEKLGQYLCELALMNGDAFLKYLPSEVAVSAVCLALHTLRRQPWPNALVQYSGYSKDDVHNCIRDLHRIYCNSSYHPQQAIREKYSTDKYLRVAQLKPPVTLPL